MKIGILIPVFINLFYSSGQAPIATINDDSFSSYATPMEAHSSGYSTPMIGSNLASPQKSLTESFVEEVDEEQDETTVEENSKASPQVSFNPFSASPLPSNVSRLVCGVYIVGPTLRRLDVDPSTVPMLFNPLPQASPAQVPASETLSVKPIKASLALETQPVEETLARSSSANNSDCRPSPDVKEKTDETVETQVEFISSPSTNKVSEVSIDAPGSAQTVSNLNQSAHCPVASCTATVSSTSDNNVTDSDPQPHDRSASIGEIRFCFTEAGSNNEGSPSREFIRSLPTLEDPSNMDAHLVLTVEYYFFSIHSTHLVLEKQNVIAVVSLEGKGWNRKV